MKRRFSNNSLMTFEFELMLFIAVIIISIIGLFSVYSATRSLGTNSNIISQCVAFGIGLALMIFACFFDYEQYIPLIKYILFACIVLLIAVLMIGIAGSWGARSWLRVGSIGIQPSELAKTGFILTFSYHLSKVTENINKPLILLGLMLHCLIPIVLIMMQPDLGTTLVFIFMFLVMMFTAKISYKYVIPVATAGVVSVPIIYYFVLSEYQQRRIQVFLDPELDPLKDGYNVIQSKIAVGSGGVFGAGYLEGTQNQLGYLPTKYTDFIFSTIAEEWGFFGALAVIFLLFFIIVKCFSVAKKADNLFGRYICTGVGAMLLFHTFENIGMCMGLMPVTGIPLPFISYGGTSLMTNMLSIGIVMSVAYHNKPRSIFEVY